MVMDFSDTVYMDDSAVLTVERMIEAALDKGIHVVVMGLQDRIADTLQALGALDKVPRDRIVSNLDEAGDLATRILVKT